MLKFSVIFVCAFLCGAYARTAPHIVNGQNAREGEFRYAVSLRGNLRHTCGGTILNERFILTAAHCVCQEGRPLYERDYSIQYGSVHISESRERSVDVKTITCHPEYDETRIEADVAVLELVHAIPHDGTWETVRLSHDIDTSREHHGVVVGWGRLYQNGPIPETLQKLDVTTYTNLVCGLRFNNFHHICFGATQGAGVCNGDSGTALMVDGIQVGVASFITNTCGTTSRLTPNVYARVPSYLHWIEEHSRLH